MSVGLFLLNAFDLSPKRAAAPLEDDYHHDVVQAQNAEYFAGIG
jgi:hypothetical protein